MSKRTLFLFAVFLLAMSPAQAKDTYDMGAVQILGKDAQEGQFKPDPEELSQDMGEKNDPAPDILPEAVPEPKPLDEKPFQTETLKRSRDEVSLALGVGTRGSKELQLSGKGTYNNYVGEVKLSRETRDGYRSSIGDEKNNFKAGLTSSGEGSFEFAVKGSLGSEKFSQRGTRTNPTRFAGIDDDNRTFEAKGHSTLEDGGFFAAHLDLDSGTRLTKNAATAFEEEGSMLSSDLGAEYIRKMKPNLTGKATIDLQRDTYDLPAGVSQKFTKRTIRFLGDLEIKERSFIEFGLKSLSLMEDSRVSPYLRFDYRWPKPWQMILTYEEDLKNDRMRDIYLPRRYVEFSGLKASHWKSTRFAVNYRGDGNEYFGGEIFRETEKDALEFRDRFDPAKGMLASCLRFAPKAERKGATLGGLVNLDQHFSLGVSATFQTPRDDSTGKRLSYEPRRILDVKFGYRGGKLSGEFTRKALFDRIAYIPTAQVDAGDYSRSDLVLRYDVSKNFQAYFKIKDLYDEAKSLRYDSPEEGRVSLAGLETHF